MQFRHETDLTAGECAVRKAWRGASPPPCLRGLDGPACGLARHGAYMRKTPRGMRVARWYCRGCQTTFSALPDCMSARLPGSLDDAEAVARDAAETGISEAARTWRRRSEDFANARRWVRRRVELAAVCLIVARGLLPALAGVEPELGAVATELESAAALAVLRRRCGPLRQVPYPVGFDLRIRRSGSQTGPPTVDGTARAAGFPRKCVPRANQARVETPERGDTR